MQKEGYDDRYDKMLYVFGRMLQMVRVGSLVVLVLFVLTYR